MTKLRFTILLTIAFPLLLGSLAAQRYDGDAGQYVILNAQYGTEHHHVDVTQRLKEVARHDQRFRVEYDTINVDPAPGRSKMLRIYARGPNGREETFDFPDGSIFDGSQFRGWDRGDWGEEHWNRGWNGRNDRDEGQFLILTAQYGTERRHVDVTPKLKRLARHDVTFRIDNGSFGVDPDRGHRKVLRIYARDPEGRERMFEYPEYNWVDGSQFRGWGSGEWGDRDYRWSGRWERDEHDWH